MHEASLPVSEVALPSLLQQVRAVAAEAARVKGIELVIPHVEDDVSIRTHPGSLAKVLVNLLDNAIKYTDEGTTATGFGIGLTVVKNSVNRLDGELSLESAVGDGTTVVLTLPR